MYNYDAATDAMQTRTVSGLHALPKAMLDEIHDHLIYVLKEKLDWMDATNPEMAMGSGHVVIRFERGGQRYVFRVAKHGLQQHKRTMLAYRHVGHLGVMPEKMYHDGVSLLERHADGLPLSAQVSDLVWAQLATQLARLHAMPAEGFGPLGFDSQGTYANASAYYQARPTLDVDWAEMDVLEEQFDAINAAVLDANSVPEVLLTTPVQLGHGDLWRNNILVTPAGFKILDWDHIGAYPVERDLAFLLELGLSNDQRAIFFAHYAQRESVNPDLLRWFAKRHILRDRSLRLSKKLAKIQSIDRMGPEVILGLA
jgi:Phosphotransferase enzyme family